MRAEAAVAAAAPGDAGAGGAEKWCFLSLLARSRACLGSLRLVALDAVAALPLPATVDLLVMVPQRSREAEKPRSREGEKQRSREAEKRLQNKTFGM